MAQGGGAGFVVRGDDGEPIIVTNSHVVWGATEIAVERNDHRVDRAVLAGSDPAVDLAVLRFASKPELPVLSFGDDLSLRAGDAIISIGSPAGVLNAVSLGILSTRAKVPEATIPGEQSIEYLFTDALLSPGCSGGPVLDAQGAVVGVNAAVAAGSRGLGIAIPSHLAARVVRALERGGHYAHSRSGVQVADDLADGHPHVTAIAASATGVDVQVGDRIVAIDGTPLDTVADFRWREFMDGPGTKWQVDLLRAGHDLSTEWHLHELSSGNQ
jgi:serine protease Do